MAGRWSQPSACDVAGTVRMLPREPGVYRFRDRRGEVLYVGRAAHLRSRVGSYLTGPPGRPHLAPMVRAIAQIEAVACASRHEAAWLERNLLERRLPRWNRSRGGQETPVIIVLDDGPRRPGLRVAHLCDTGTAELAVFGPYLGGLQARRAVSGLSRIHPLAYTATQLSAGEQAVATSSRSARTTGMLLPRR